MDNLSKITSRKDKHIDLSLKENVESISTNGFENYRLIHNALPEIDFNEIDTSTIFLEKKLKAPLIVSSMTGGTEVAGRINRNLAIACQKIGVAMGVGSQRIAVEKVKSQKSKVKSNKGVEITSFQVRDVAPDILLFGNLGAVQLNYGYGLKELELAISMISADALFLHLNPLQEVIQTEGDGNFENILKKIGEIAQKLSVPLVVKEVGNGISYQVAKRLKSVGIKIVDTAGAGGTSWAYIEAKSKDNLHLTQTFRNWGIPTVESIIACRKAGLTTIGSGGVRTGIEVVKALALGASLCGIALPFLELGVKDEKVVIKKLKEITLELKIAMFCCGVKTIRELQGNKSVITRISNDFYKKPD